MINPLSSEVLARAKICNETRYQVTNHVQPCYVVVVLNPENYTIECASDNAQSVFGSDARQIIGKNFLSLLEESSATALDTLLTQENISNPDYQERFPAKISIAHSQLDTEVVFYRSGDCLCADIETPDFQDINTHYLNLLFLRLAGNINNYSGESAELAHVICKAIHKIIGFDRVWYCEFDRDGNGYVSGEYNNGTLPELLHHRFPSTDIPNNLRKVYAENKFRTVSHTEHTPATMINAEGNAAGAIDLTYSIARQPGDTHREYLTNMGVGASASFSVVRDGKLISIFGAHNKMPCLLKYRQLAACQYLVEQYLVKFDLLSDREKREATANKEEAIDALIDKMTTHGFAIEKILAKESSSFHTILDATGFLCRHEGKVLDSAGLDNNFKELLITQVTEQLSEEPIFFTDSLQGLDQRFATIKEKASGVLAVRIDHDDSDTLFIWLRQEFAYDEKWAGDPSQAVLQDESGKVGPRTSFDAWLRRVEGHCVPWKPHEIEVAEKLRNAYVLKKALYLGELGVENAKRLDTVLNTVVDGIISIDHKGTVLAFNPAAERIFGYTTDEVIGQNVKMLMPESDSKQHDSYISNYLKTGDAKVIGIGREVTAQRKDGTTFPIELGINEVQLADERFFVGITRDISERKAFEESLKAAKEEAEKANAYKSQFLANMSHELRTPLHTMTGFVESIMEKIDTMPKEKQLQYLELVHSSSERLLLLINDLLDLAKLESGMMKFTLAQHNLRTVITASISEVNKLIEEKRLHVSCDIDGEMPLVFDRERMVQVVINLISNAAKFTPEEKRIDIRVSTTAGKVVLEVADQGVGVPEEELEAVFDKFIQSSKTKTEAGGTGLGLSICREIMQAHQGRIWAENNTNGGASFFVEFPTDLEEKTITL